MIFRNSMLSILRTKGKTILFILLIFTLTLSLCLSISVWASVSRYLQDLNEHYTTIGLIEYIGADYPNDTVYDESMAEVLNEVDFSAIKEFESTILWDKSSRTIGYVDGFFRTDPYIPNNGASALVVGSVTPAGDGLYSAIISEVLYSNLARKNTRIIINAGDKKFEYGHYYLIYGDVYRALSNFLYFDFKDYSNLIAQEMGIEVPSFLDITTDRKSGARYKIPENCPLYQVADTWEVINNSVLVCATDSVMSLFPFHQQELYIKEGRPFSAQEYKNGSKVCIISEIASKRIGVGVGDTINMSIAVSEYPGILNSFWIEDGFQYSDTFTVVGITNNTTDKDYYIYIPKSVNVPMSPYYIGYTVGQAVIENSDAAVFYEKVEPLMTGRLHLTVYDQGYEAVAEPFNIILSVVKIVTVVCAIMELAMLLLFGFLFVYRQKEASEIMLLLGSGRKRVCAYFLYSSGLISLIASALGATAGYYLHGSVVSFVWNIAKSYTTVDRRFSDGNLSIVKSIEFVLNLEPNLFIYAGLIVFALAILFCITFTVLTFVHSRASQRKIPSPKKARGTSHLSGGSIKYALLSILRGGARSAVVPIVAVAVVIFFGQLANTSNNYQKQLSEIYKNTTVSGYFTDINGKQVGNLLVESYDLCNLYHSGYITDLTVSYNINYYYLGISKRSNGTEWNIDPLYVPQGFAADTLRNQIRRGPSLVATNDIRTAPEFFYAENIVMDFIDGYDESFFSDTYEKGDVLCCMIPISLMEEKGINLGDTIRIAIDMAAYSPEYDAVIFRQIDFRVVGCFEKQGMQDLIYAPISTVFDTELIWGEKNITSGAPFETFVTGYEITDEQKRWLYRTVFKSAGFKLLDTTKLAEFKDYLQDYGYSQVNKIGNIREFVVLRDKRFNNVVNGIKQQMRYIDVLYPCLYTLIWIIALIISYLLTISRKVEFAIMRGLGSTKIHTFLSFFTEQAILCGVGCALGTGVWKLFRGEIIPLHQALVFGFLICYFIGSAVSIVIMNSKNVFEILTDKD